MARYEEQILDFIECKLSPAEHRAFENALVNDPELKRCFNEYQEVMQLESRLSEVDFVAAEGFESQLFEKIADKKVVDGRPDLGSIFDRHFYTSFASTMIIMLAVLPLFFGSSHKVSLSDSDTWIHPLELQADDSKAVQDLMMTDADLEVFLKMIDKQGKEVTLEVGKSARLKLPHAGGRNGVMLVTTGSEATKIGSAEALFSL